MMFIPSGNRVLIKPEEADSTSKDGILPPDAVKEKPLRGKIVAMGEGKRMKDGKFQHIMFDENNIVLYTRYAGNEINLDGEDYLVLDADQILGVLNK